MVLIPMMYLIVSTISPGPVTVLTLHNTARNGRFAGFAVAFGGAATTAIFVLIAALLTTGDGLINISPDTTHIYKQASAFLILAIGFLTGYRSLIVNQTPAEQSPQANSKAKSFFAGMLLMLPYLPQAILFYTVILPQYAAPANLISTVLSMGLLKVLLTIIWYSTLSCLAIRVQKWFFKTQVQRAVGVSVSCFFVGTGIKLLIG